VKKQLPPNSPLKNAVYFIIDEISMVSQEKLAKMQQILGVNGKGSIFGNISYIFFGDFLQFTPVGGTSIISINENRTSSYHRSSNQLLSNQVLNAINYMVELTEQKRQTDEKYLEMLRHIRSGHPTEQDVEYLRKFCKMPPLDQLSSEFIISAEYIVSDNKKRIEWNHRVVRSFARHYGRDILRIPALDSVTGFVNEAVSKEMELVVKDYLQKYIDVVIGMPMLVLKNLYKTLGVVNGSIGIFRAVHHDEQGHLHAIELHFPDLNFQVPGLPKSSLLFCREKTFGSLNIHSVSCNFTRDQFPLTEGFCLTDYKKQGASVKTHAVISLEGNMRNDVSSYVKLSRSKSAATTFIDGNFQLSHLQIKMPSGYENFKKILSQKQKRFLELNETNFLLH
jgi:ATP-dependent exoDNAse (exonuclease V) alpha subunit